MVFKKGEIQKKAGRPKGSINKSTEKSKEIIAEALDKGAPIFLKNLKMLKPKDFCEVYLKAMEFNIPKMARVENTSKQPTSITINMVAATPELIEQNTIDITHEEIDNE